MGAFYGTKIKSGEVNTDTGKAWVFENVPAYWRPKAKKWLEDEGYSIE